MLEGPLHIKIIGSNTIVYALIIYKGKVILELY